MLLGMWSGCTAKAVIHGDLSGFLVMTMVISAATLPALAVALGRHEWACIATTLGQITYALCAVFLLLGVVSASSIIVLIADGHELLPELFFSAQNQVRPLGARADGTWPGSAPGCDCSHQQPACNQTFAATCKQQTKTPRACNKFANVPCPSARRSAFQ